YGPQNDVTLKMPAFEWVHVQLHQQKGMISLSPPTICNSASQSGLIDLQRVAASMEADATAIHEAISSRWSNGVVEGHVNRLKMLKRQMYGRAGFELLRRRVMSPLA
ncbi:MULTISPECIES: transposase, partial [Klebsiella pneumoniae complex]